MILLSILLFKTLVMFTHQADKESARWRDGVMTNITRLLGGRASSDQVGKIK